MIIHIFHIFLSREENVALTVVGAHHARTPSSSCRAYPCCLTCRARACQAAEFHAMTLQGADLIRSEAPIGKVCEGIGKAKRERLSRLTVSQLA